MRVDALRVEDVEAGELAEEGDAAFEFFDADGAVGLRVGVHWTGVVGDAFGFCGEG